MSLGDFWLQFNNGKKLDLNNLKSGLNKKDIDKKFHSLFDVLDADKNKILTADEAGLIYNLATLIAGEDKKLSVAEEKSLFEFLGIDTNEKIDLAEFVQKFDKIEDSQEGYYADGTRVVQTTYTNGKIETLILYPDGGVKFREVKTPKQSVNSPEIAPVYTKYDVKREYSERAKADLQEQSMDWILDHVNENIKMISDYWKSEGFLKKSTESIMDIFGKSLNSVQQELIEQHYLARNSDLSLYNQKLGGSFTPEKYEAFLETDSKYMNARFWKSQTDELQKGLKSLRSAIQGEINREKLASRQNSSNTIGLADAYNKKVPTQKRDSEIIFAEIFNKYCAGNKQLAQQLMTEIAGDITSSKQLTHEKMLEIADKLEKISQQLLKDNLGGETYEQLEKRFQSEYKGLYGKEDYTDYIQERMMKIEGWAGMEKIAIITITQILIGFLTSGSSVAAEGVASTALAAGGRAAGKGLVAKFMASQAAQKLVVTYGEAKVMRWAQQAMKFLMLTGTVVEDVGLGFLDAATSENGITWEKSNELLKQGLSSAKYIYFGGYISGPVASFIGSKIKTAGAVAMAFKGGSKVTQGAVTTTTITADKFISSMQSKAIKFMAGTASLGTEIGAFALLDLATEDVGIKDALSGSADMQVKLKIMNRLLETLLGGLVNKISSGKASAMPKLDAEIEKALKDKALKNLNVIERKTPTGTLYSIEGDGKILCSAKDPNMLVVSLTSYLASTMNMAAIIKEMEEMEAEVKPDEAKPKEKVESEVKPENTKVGTENRPAETEVKPENTKFETGKNSDLVNEFDAYIKGLAEHGEDYVPDFIDNASPLFKEYFNYKKERNNNAGNADIKIRKTNTYSKMQALMDIENFIKNKSTVATREDYIKITDEIAKLMPEYIKAKYPRVRPEIAENADKIYKWKAAMSGQKQPGTPDANGKYPITTDKFFDAEAHDKAVKEFTEFLEEMTGKKVLVGNSVRFDEFVNMLGCFNNPDFYKDVDYIVLGHGTGSSLVTDNSDPNAWVFKGNGESVWDYISDNIPKGKKALLLVCEHDGKTQTERNKMPEMYDDNGVYMDGIGDVTSGMSGAPAKIAISGVNRVVGTVECKQTISARELMGGGIGGEVTVKKYSVNNISKRIDLNKTSYTTYTDKDGNKIYKVVATATPNEKVGGYDFTYDVYKVDAEGNIIDEIKGVTNKEIKEKYGKLKNEEIHDNSGSDNSGYAYSGIPFFKNILDMVTGNSKRKISSRRTKTNNERLNNRENNLSVNTPLTHMYDSRYPDEIIMMLEDVCNELNLKNDKVRDDFLKDIEPNSIIYNNRESLKEYLQHCINMYMLKAKDGSQLFTIRAYNFTSKKVEKFVDFDLIRNVGELLVSCPEMHTQLGDRVISAFMDGNIDEFEFRSIVHNLKNGYISPGTLDVAYSKYKTFRAEDLVDSEAPNQYTLGWRKDMLLNIETTYPQLKSKIAKLKNELGDDIYKIHWETLENIHNYNTIYDFVTDAKNLVYLKKTRLNANNFYIRIPGYKEITVWGNDIAEVSNTAGAMLDSGASFDEVMSYISYAYRELDAKIINKKNDEYKLQTSGMLRCARDGYMYDDSQSEHGAITRFDRNDRYGLYYYDRFMQHTNANELKNPYPSMINLTRIDEALEKEIPFKSYNPNNPEHSYRIGPDGKCHYYETSPAMVHPKGKYANNSLNIVYSIHDALMHKYHGKHLTQADMADINESIGEIHWILSHSMPWGRGSAGISDAYVKALYKSLGIQLSRPKEGISFDLEAFCTELEVYKKNYKNLYEKEPKYIKPDAEVETEVKPKNSDGIRQKESGLKTDNDFIRYLNVNHVSYNYVQQGSRFIMRISDRTKIFNKHRFDYYVFENGKLVEKRLDCTKKEMGKLDWTYRSGKSRTLNSGVDPNKINEFKKAHDAAQSLRDIAQPDESGKVSLDGDDIFDLAQRKYSSSNTKSVQNENSSAEPKETPKQNPETPVQKTPTHAETEQKTESTEPNVTQEPKHNLVEKEVFVKGIAKRLNISESEIESYIQENFIIVDENGKIDLDNSQNKDFIASLKKGEKPAKVSDVDIVKDSNAGSNIPPSNPGGDPPPSRKSKAEFMNILGINESTLQTLIDNKLVVTDGETVDLNNPTNKYIMMRAIELVNKLNEALNSEPAKSEPLQLQPVTVEQFITGCMTLGVSRDFLEFYINNGKIKVENGKIKFWEPVNVKFQKCIKEFVKSLKSPFTDEEIATYERKTNQGKTESSNDKKSEKPAFGLGEKPATGIEEPEKGSKTELSTDTEEPNPENYTPRIVTVKEFAEIIGISPTNVGTQKGIVYYRERINGKLMIDLNCENIRKIIKDRETKTGIPINIESPTVTVQEFAKRFGINHINNVYALKKSQGLIIENGKIDLTIPKNREIYETYKPGKKKASQKTYPKQEAPANLTSTGKAGKRGRKPKTDENTNDRTTANIGKEETPTGNVSEQPVKNMATLAGKSDVEILIELGATEDSAKKIAESDIGKIFLQTLKEESISFEKDKVDKTTLAFITQNLLLDEATLHVVMLYDFPDIFVDKDNNKIPLETLKELFNKNVESKRTSPEQIDVDMIKGKLSKFGFDINSDDVAQALKENCEMVAEFVRHLDSLEEIGMLIDRTKLTNSTLCNYIKNKGELPDIFVNTKERRQALLAQIPDAPAAIKNILVNYATDKNFKIRKAEGNDSTVEFIDKDGNVIAKGIINNEEGTVKIEKNGKVELSKRINDFAKNLYKLEKMGFNSNVIDIIRNKPEDKDTTQAIKRLLKHISDCEKYGKKVNTEIIKDEEILLECINCIKKGEALPNIFKGDGILKISMNKNTGELSVQMCKGCKIEFYDLKKIFEKEFDTTLDGLTQTKGYIIEQDYDTCKIDIENEFKRDNYTHWDGTALYKLYDNKNNSQYKQKIIELIQDPMWDKTHFITYHDRMRFLDRVILKGVADATKITAPDAKSNIKTVLDKYEETISAYLSGEKGPIQISKYENQGKTYMSAEIIYDGQSYMVGFGNIPDTFIKITDKKFYVTTLFIPVK